jgi:hypothetical protein
VPQSDAVPPAEPNQDPAGVTLAGDLTTGATDAGAIVTRAGAPEVVLTPKLAGDFAGDTLPGGWSIVPWVAGGTGVLGDGMLTLAGASLRCEPLLLSPRSLEFSAVFAARPDQHIGFGTDFVAVPWLMFSTKWGRRLYGRTHLLTVEDKKLAGDWFGAPHRYRIDWNVLDLKFSVDGTCLAHLMVPMPGYMRPLAANQRLGGEPLRIEWMRVSPYAPAGRFTSGVLDAGAPVDWRELSWDAIVPDRTTLGIRVRTGDAPVPGGSWSRWRRLARSGDGVGAQSRYAQYRADLATADPSSTPALRAVRLRYSSAGDGAAGGVSSSSFVSGRTLGCQ